MLDSLTTFLSGLKQATPTLLFGLVLASGLVLFATESFVTTLGLAEFRQANMSYLGGTFVVAVALLVSHLVFGSTSWIRRGIARHRRHKSLRELTPDEKAYLIPYVVNDQNTAYYLIEDGIAGGLTAKGIIYRASSVGSIVDGWAFNIQPWAKTYLKSHLELLGGANPDPESPRNW